VGLCGLVAVILASLNERRRELAILRSVGARPADVFLLLSAEGIFVTVCGALAGVTLLAMLSALLAPMLQARYGIAVTPRFIAPGEWGLLGTVMGISLLSSLVPGYGAYRLSLADGLTPRI
jgi:putative ABC transport system permease protein